MKRNLENAGWEEKIATDELMNEAFKANQVQTSSRYQYQQQPQPPTQQQSPHPTSRTYTRSVETTRPGERVAMPHHIFPDPKRLLITRIYQRKKTIQHQQAQGCSDKVGNKLCKQAYIDIENPLTITGKFSDLKKSALVLSQPSVFGD